MISDSDLYRRGQESGYRKAKEHLQDLFTRQLDILVKEKFKEMSFKFQEETRIIAERVVINDFQNDEFIGKAFTYRLPVLTFQIQLRPNKELIEVFEGQAIACAKEPTK